MGGNLFGNFLGTGGGPSSGMVTGPQQAFASYTGAENMIGNAGTPFSGMPTSTGLTQADAGARVGEAMSLAQQSDANAAAQASLQNAQKGATSRNLSTLGGGLGSLLGGGGGGGGG
jgi:hypothetical protein